LEVPVLNTIKWTPKATKQLRKIKDIAMQQRIFAETNRLQKFPECPKVKRLVNHQYTYRLRVGNYRVFFEFEGEVKIISVEEVKKRDEQTY
jgi:mRNA-degrading endonuclease RelE of RelBE toxin-antitoxin system